LRAGKHVLCESFDDGLGRIGTSRRAHRETGKVGGVAYNLRYYPLCQEAAPWLKTEPSASPTVHGSFLQDWLLYPSDWNWRLDPKLGGQLRAVSDIGTHWLDWSPGSPAASNGSLRGSCHRGADPPETRGRVETFQKADPANADPCH